MIAVGRLFAVMIPRPRYAPRTDRDVPLPANDFDFWKAVMKVGYTWNNVILFPLRKLTARDDFRFRGCQKHDFGRWYIRICLIPRTLISPRMDQKTLVSLLIIELY